MARLRASRAAGQRSASRGDRCRLEARPRPAHAGGRPRTRSTACRPAGSPRPARRTRRPRCCGSPPSTGLAVVARGAGTKLAWGTPPRRLDVLVDTGRLDRVVEHAAGDLVVIVQAGVPAGASSASELAGAGQRLAVDEVVPGTHGRRRCWRPALSGPRRLLVGTVRDLRPRRHPGPRRRRRRPRRRQGGQERRRLRPGQAGLRRVRHARPGHRGRPSGCTRSRRRRLRRASGSPRRRRPRTAAVQRVLHAPVRADRGRAGPAGAGGPVEVARARRGHRGRRGRPRAGPGAVDALGAGAGETGPAGLVGPAAGRRGPGQGDHRADRRRPRCSTPSRRPAPAHASAARPGSASCTVAPARRRGAPAAVAALRGAAPALAGSVVVLAAPAAVRAEVDSWGPVPRAGPDAPGQGPVRPGRAAGARPLRGRHLTCRSTPPSGTGRRRRRGSRCRWGCPPSTTTARRHPSWSPTACTAASACPPARRTCCGARRWTRPRGRIYLMSQGLGGEPLTDSMVEPLRPLPRLHGLRDGLPVRRAVRQADRGDPGPGRARPPPLAERAGCCGRRSSRCSRTRGGCGCCAARCAAYQRTGLQQRWSGAAGCWTGSRRRWPRWRTSRRRVARCAALPERVAARGARRTSSACSPAACRAPSSPASTRPPRGCWRWRAATSSSRAGRAAAARSASTTDARPEAQALRPQARSTPSRPPAWSGSSSTRPAAARP